ncbi:MAG: cellulase family glycosylhydrolase [Bacteroidota bacterium]
MSSRIFHYLFLIGLLSIFTSNISAQKLSRITVQGNQFVNEQGEKVIFRGLNASDPDNLEKAGHWDKAYFEEIKNWGATIVRFPVHPRAWNERGKKAYLKLLDNGVQWATELGLYVVMDWHSIGNLKEEKFQHEMYETDFEETLKFWKVIAKRYGDNPTVAFYELFNEPTLGGGKYGKCSWSEWKLMMEQTIDLIRKKGGRGVPLVAGFNWAYFLNDVADNPIEATGIGYVSHPYPQKRKKPWEAQWIKDWGFVKEKYPLMLTEIGFCEPEARGAHIPVISDESYGEAITAYCDTKDISYVVWVFDPEWSPMLFLDWAFTPSRQGRFFKEKLQGY